MAPRAMECKGDRGHRKTSIYGYPLDAAAFTQDRKALTIAAVNPSDQIGVTLRGVRLGSQGRVWKIAAANWNPRNDPGNPREVDIVESTVNQAPATLVSPQVSIEIFEFPVQEDSAKRSAAV